MARNVIFDLGGVVVEWSPERILEGYYSDPSLRTMLRAALFQHADWLQFDRGTLTETALLARLEDRTGRPTAELAGLLDAVRASLHAKPDTVALLGKLHARAVPLYCLSNISTAMFGYLRSRYSFWEVFRGIVISGEIRMLKPEREIFELILQRFGLDASQTVFVDDNPPNIEAARALGLATVWFRSADQCEVELDELLTSR